MSQMEKTQDVEALLRKIIDFMQNSGVAFDKAATGEARRLAVCILALIEDTKTTPSLLSRAGLKDISFIDSSPDYNEKLGLPLCGLTLVTLGAKTMNYVPRFDKCANIKSLSFDLWWNKPVIIDKEKGVEMTRRDIVHAVIATNVGTTDPRFHRTYEEITNVIPFGQTPSKGLGGDLIQPLYASVRQISYELLGSLYDRAPQYFSPRQ